MILFFNFYLNVSGFISISLKQLLKRLDLWESKQFFVEFSEYFFVGSLAGVSLWSLHHLNCGVNYLHYELSVVLIFTQLYFLILIPSICILYF